MRALSALVLVLAACGGSAACERPAWRSVFGADLDRSVLSISGGSRSDVWLVGGGLGVPGRGALVLRWDGRAWRELPTGRAETLWWAWGAGPNDVWLVGEQGLVLRWDGASFRAVASGTTATLYGVWGSGPSDVWIVGGLPGAGRVEDNDVVLRWDGQTLRRDATLARKGATLFKVWGAGAGDVWVSGELGTLWRWTPAGWQDYAPSLAVRDSLLTVHGCGPSEVYAVGGTTVHRFDGTSWAAVRQAPSGANGVACGRDQVLVVGNGGLKTRFEKATGTWTDDRLAEPFRTDFHGAWVSPEGDLWAGGGNFLLPPGAGSRRGVVGYRGCAPPAAALAAGG